MVQAMPAAITGSRFRAACRRHVLGVGVVGVGFSYPARGLIPFLRNGGAKSLRKSPQCGSPSHGCKQEESVAVRAQCREFSPCYREGGKQHLTLWPLPSTSGG